MLCSIKQLNQNVIFSVQLVMFSVTKCAFVDKLDCLTGNAGNIEYFMESVRVQCLHTSCGVSEIEQVSA